MRTRIVEPKFEGLRLCLAVDGADRLVRLSFLGNGMAFDRHVLPDDTPDPFACPHIVTQLEEYFARTRTHFEFEIAPVGTEFQLEVWAALREIPYGETRSYSWLAKHLGRPDASRAVGAATAANPIAIVIPCHRVIGINGALTGFAGGLDVKSRLLELEQGSLFL